MAEGLALGNDHSIAGDSSILHAEGQLAGVIFRGETNGSFRVTAQIDEAKFSYLFGKVTSGRKHNIDRSAQNKAQFARIGLHDSPATRRLLRDHFDEVVQTDNNIIETETNQYGTFQKRDSFLAGPGGFVRLESTWQLTDGGLRLTTVIPRG